MMNWTTYFIECVASVILFTLAILVPLCKNPEWWIHDYPEDIQEEYFKTHPRIPSAFFSKTVLLKKSFALLLAVAIFVGLALLAGARDFLSAFLASYGLWLVVDWYDCLVLDWVLFANLKRVRLPGTRPPRSLICKQFLNLYPQRPTSHPSIHPIPEKNRIFGR